MNADPRVRVVDFSSFRTFGWSIHGFLMTDVFVEVFGAERLKVCAPTSLAGRASSRLRRGGRIVRSASGRARLRPTEGGAPLGSSADLLFAFATDLGDLEILSATRQDWSPNHSIKILWTAELWTSALRNRHGAELDFLRDFDLIVCSNAQAATALVPYARRPVVQMLPAIDVLAAPWTMTPAIDVLNIGRRSPSQHQALLRWTEANQGWYHFDTIGPPTVTEPYMHRLVMASLFAHSAMSISNFARFDQPEITGSHAEAGARYAEALAAGTVIAGTHPTNELFQSEAGFGGLEGIEHLPLTGVVPIEEIDRLVRVGRNPEVRSGLRRRACLHHDWGHRIAEICELIDVREPTRLQERKKLLVDGAP